MKGNNETEQTEKFYCTCCCESCELAWNLKTAWLHKRGVGLGLVTLLRSSPSAGFACISAEFHVSQHFQTVQTLLSAAAGLWVPVAYWLEWYQWHGVGWNKFLENTRNFHFSALKHGNSRCHFVFWEDYCLFVFFFPVEFHVTIWEVWAAQQFTFWSEKLLCGIG